MEWIKRMTATVDYIENHLIDDIMYDEVAKIACCSMHQFGRAFSGMHGVTPKVARTLGVRLKAYPRITFHISMFPLKHHIINTIFKILPIFKILFEY